MFETQMRYCLGSFADSSSYFEAPVPSQDRFLCIKAFLALLVLLPFVLGFKLIKSFFRVVGVFLGVSFFILTLGMSFNIHEFLIRRVSLFSSDLADWLLFPFAILSCCLRLLWALF